MANSPQDAANVAGFTFRMPEVDAQQLRITRFDGREALDELFTFSLEFVSSERELAPESFVGKAGQILITSPNHGTREVNGILRSFERIGEGVNSTYYAAELVPLHWQLTRRKRSRVFIEANCADMSVPGIIKKVVADAGLPADCIRPALQSSYSPRDFVAQYRESDFDFIARLMEHEGMFYFFEHKDGKHVLVFGDSPAAHVNNTHGSQFPFREASGLQPAERAEHVFRLKTKRSIRIGSVTRDDFNFTKPGVDIADKVEASAFTALHDIDYPGEYAEKPEGKKLAGIRLQAYQCRVAQQQMSATIRGMHAGFRFTLQDHPAANLNREYLVTAVNHRARLAPSAEGGAAERGEAYIAKFETIASDVPYRPQLKTEKPFVHGTQTAIVVGPAGEEIYTDKYGRVKIQFHWDHQGTFNENSSFWVRVAHGLAGGQYGIMFLPRVGQEVIVDFLEGNPDRPIVVGRVMNNDHMPAYPLPDEKTKSYIKTHSSKGGGGTNEIRFEDLKGKEQLGFFAEKDMHVRAKADRVANIGHNDDLTVYCHQRYKVNGSASLTVGGNRVVVVGGDMTYKVTGNFYNEIKGDRVEDIFGKLHVIAPDVFVEAQNSIVLGCGSSSIVITPGAIFINAPIVNINSGSGPPGVASAAQAGDASTPGAADQVKPGRDHTYTGDPNGPGPVTPIDPPRPPDDPDDPGGDASISFDLKDEDGNPIPHEPFEVLLPNGFRRTGSLDREGFARIENIPPGECQITFPRIDGAEWRRRAT